MDIFLAILTGCMQAMKTPMTIYGFTFSFWEVMLFSIFVPIIIGFILALGDS